jgi:hypothetical protein
MAQNKQQRNGDLYRVVTPTFVAGAMVADGRVVHAAPILRRAIGKTLDNLKHSVESRGGTVTSCS